MNIDPSIRTGLFEIALWCGGLFAAYRMLLTVTYSILLGMLWQHVLGPVIEARWKGSAQSKDYERPPYMPLEPVQPYVIAWGLRSTPVDEITHGIRDGLSLGVFATLLTEGVLASCLILIASFVLTTGVRRIFRERGADRTDQVFRSSKDVLIFLGAIAVLNHAHVSLVQTHFPLPCETLTAAH